MEPEEILPAIMITIIHPKYFLERNNQQVLGESVPETEIVFIKLKDTCKQPADVLNIIEKIFEDIKAKKEIRNFQVSKEQKAGFGGALVNSLILEPNFFGVGVSLKKVFQFSSN